MTITSVENVVVLIEANYMFIIFIIIGGKQYGDYQNDVLITLCRFHHKAWHNTEDGRVLNSFNLKVSRIEIEKCISIFNTWLINNEIRTTKVVFKPIKQKVFVSNLPVKNKNKKIKCKPQVEALFNRSKGATLVFVILSGLYKSRLCRALKSKQNFSKKKNILVVSVYENDSFENVLCSGFEVPVNILEFIAFR